MAAPETYATIARILDAADQDDSTREAADKAAEGILGLCEDLTLTSYLDEFGDVPSREAYLDVVDEMAQDAIGSGSRGNDSPKSTGEERGLDATI